MMRNSLYSIQSTRQRWGFEYPEVSYGCHFELLTFEKKNRNDNRCRIEQQAFESLDEITYSLTSVKCLSSMLSIFRQIFFFPSFLEIANVLQDPQACQQERSMNCNSEHHLIIQLHGSKTGQFHSESRNGCNLTTAKMRECPGLVSELDLQISCLGFGHMNLKFAFSLIYANISPRLSSNEILFGSPPGKLFN